MQKMESAFVKNNNAQDVAKLREENNKLKMEIFKLKDEHDFDRDDDQDMPVHRVNSDHLLND